MYPMQMPQGGNNPMAMLMQALRAGKDPAALVRQMAAQDPRAGMALRLMQGKDPGQLRNTVENMARERGIDLDQMMQSLGLPRR